VITAWLGAMFIRSCLRRARSEITSPAMTIIAGQPDLLFCATDGRALALLLRHRITGLTPSGCPPCTRQIGTPDTQNCPAIGLGHWQTLYKTNSGLLETYLRTICSGLTAACAMVLATLTENSNRHKRTVTSLPKATEEKDYHS